MALLVEGRGGELGDAHVTGVQLGDQALDRAALARGVPTLEENAHRRAELAVAALAAEHEAQLEQALLRGGEPLRLLLPGELERQVQLIEAAHDGHPRTAGIHGATRDGRPPPRFLPLHGALRALRAAPRPVTTHGS